MKPAKFAESQFMPSGNHPAEIVLSRSQVRAIDAAAVEQLGISGMLLMENAARGVGEVLFQEFAIGPNDIRPTTILCGPGNNGGDGLALARQLLATDVPVDVHLVTGGKSLAPDARQNLAILNAAGVSIPYDTTVADLRTKLCGLKADDVIVDCLLGTGVSGAARSPFSEVIEIVNESAARVLAVDLPSGLDCESGVTDGECIQAERTVTFVGRKRGFLQESAREFTGEVSVAHIGVPWRWVQDWLEPNSQQHTDSRSGFYC